MLVNKLASPPQPIGFLFFNSKYNNEKEESCLAHGSMRVLGDAW